PPPSCGCRKSSRFSQDALGIVSRARHQHRTRDSRCITGQRHFGTHVLLQLIDVHPCGLGDTLGVVDRAECNARRREDVVVITVFDRDNGSLPFTAGCGRSQNNIGHAVPCRQVDRITGGGCSQFGGFEYGGVGISHYPFPSIASIIWALVSSSLTVMPSVAACASKSFLFMR